MSEFDELPETFDPSTHEGTDLKPIPPGWYQAQIVENSVEYAKNGNGTYLLAVFEILSANTRAAGSTRMSRYRMSISRRSRLDSGC